MPALLHFRSGSNDFSNGQFQRIESWSNMERNASLMDLTISTEEQTGAWVYDLTWDDATWILTSSFIIFTMQTGFGMLESGCVSVKNESNIMMKNVVDVVFGGLTYWMFGFGLSFGTSKGSSPVLGIGEYLVDSEFQIMGPVFAAFMFQLSFATTATTIVSGTMAERCNFRAYCVFSLLNTIVYCIPARWVWGPKGFLNELGTIDIAGSGAVHLLGGVSGFVAAWMLGPRLGRYDAGTNSLPLGNPTSCIVGLFILWWGWLAFNSGSTFGVSQEKWKFASRASVTTMVSSIGGGLVGCAYGFFKPGKFIEVMDLVNPILGALVGITAGCAVYHTYDAFVVGIVGAIVVILVSRVPDTLGVDDPVGAVVVHGFGGLWGMIAVGLFTEDDKGGLGVTKGKSGLFKGGGVKLLQLQLFACAAICLWSAFSTFTLLWIINKFVPIRMEAHEELLGADFVEHLVRRRNAGITPALSALQHRQDVQAVTKQAAIIGGANLGHEKIVNTIADARLKPWKKLKAKALAAAMFSASLDRLRQGEEDVNSFTPEKTLKISISSLGKDEVASVVDNSLGTPFYSEYSNHNYDHNAKMDCLNYFNDYSTKYINELEDQYFGKLPERN